MRSQRFHRVFTGGAAFVLAAALAPGIWSQQAGAQPAAGPSPAAAAAAGTAFDPARAFVPGSPKPLTTAGTAQSTSPGSGADTSGTPSADPNGGSLQLAESGGVETAQGVPVTATLPGGDSLQLHGLGAVTRVHPDGSTVWQRSTGSLYRDWHLTFPAGGYVPTPQLLFGTDPADPFYVTTAVPYAMADAQPYAVGDLDGDGSADIAVAETVGVNLGAASCGNCGWPFTVPGSDLHMGTFVTVLDGRTGTTLFSELDPGFVTQLAVSGKQLVIGDETGDPSTKNGPGAWDSATTVKAVALHAAGHGKVTAKTAWTYTTGAQWGRLLGLQPVDGGVAVSWSDTPLGLGVPGPPDGHVVLVGAGGTVRWDRRTAGYPVLTRYDADRNLIAVVEQTDPTQAVSAVLAGLRPADGSTASSTRLDGVLPTALAVGPLTAHAATSWLVAGVVTTTDLVSPPGYGYTSATVTAVDPGASRTRWSRTLATADPQALQPGSLQVLPAAGGRTTVVVGSWTGSVTPSPAAPVEEQQDLRGLSGADGSQLWDHVGDVPDPLSLAADGAAVRGVTDEQVAVTYAADGRQTRTAPLLGDLYAAVAADVNRDGRADDIAGGQSGAVYAFDGRSLTPDDDAPHVLWRADVGGPVHSIVPATVAGRRVLAVAATSGLALVDEASGRVLHRMALPGQFVWNAAVGTAGGRSVVVTGTDRVTAFDAATGKALWTYRPASASYFANTEVTGGVVVTEYQSQVEEHQDPAATAATGLDAATGRVRWTAAGDPAATESAQLTYGVAAGAGIPGAGAYGAAFTWNTTDGQGRVDVRDARTGALDYSDTDPSLTNHEDFVLDPRVGLVATGDFGSVSIAPGGPTGSPWVHGTDSAVAESGGAPVLLGADVAVSAYPLSALSATDENPVAALAEFDPYQTGQLEATAGDHVLATPVDWRRHEVLTAEAGLTVRPYDVSIQHGLADLALTGTPAAQAARQPARKAAPKAAARPGTLPLADSADLGARIGTAQPQAEVTVHGYAKDGTPQLTEAAPSGYDPATLRAYLGLHGTGAGQTVAVVDAFHDAAITSDVDAFSAQFGLPPTCAGGATTGCFHLTVSAPDGSGGTDPGWALETSMDVEWVHAVAPQASVVLVEARDGTFGSLFHAVDSAAALHPDTVSMSWGIPEEFTDETYYDAHCRLADSLCVVSSGDYGHPGSYPAYNPAALSIGGTTLQLAGDGSVTAETAWSGSGGGRSHVEPAPAYQHGVVTGGRGTPDVSFDADPASGVAVYDTAGYYGQTGWFQVGGTSLGAPAWAAVIASADQLRAAAGHGRLTSTGSAQQAVYGAAAHLGDIVSGPANGICPTQCSATPGYDFVTGLGSPRTGVDATLAAAR